MTELSVEFNRHISAVSRMSNEEDWAGMRARIAEQRLKEAGASELVLKALQGEGKIIQGARNLAASFILALQMVVDKVTQECAETKAPASARTLNDLGFAMNNLGNFVDKVGLVGMPMDLRKSRANSDGNQAGQTWEKGMLQQINVTVQNLQAQAKEAEKTVLPTVEEVA